jgi:(1->4)-alpha-D-glucan 1-alpha-D-glucosylmutase
MIDELLAFAGIDERYADAFGTPALVSRETKIAMLHALGYEVNSDEDAASVLAARRALAEHERFADSYVVTRATLYRIPGALREQLPKELDFGYYQCEGDGRSITVALAPERAFVPKSLDARPQWGLAAHVYSLTSQRNAGIGDFTDLAELASLAHRSGAAAVALNPLHQLHASNPAAASPYAPLSRRYLNALYIDVRTAAQEFCVALEGLDESAARAETLVDYPAVARFKFAALERIYEAMKYARPWASFVAADPVLRTTALYEAIMEHVRALDPGVYGWVQWPPELRDCNSEAVRAFASAHAGRVEYFCMLQWLADRQLGRAAQAASAMTIGLYRDLAVGVDLSSADVWSDPQAYVLGLSVGAPPDPLNAAGQNWGLPPFDPRVLARRGYAPFAALLRANMRHAGALRIDHVMGLRRLFCLPRGEFGGAYLNYDFEAMLGIVALESQRNRCTIVGEDLGTVPEGFRERTSAARIFSCSVLFFERVAGGAFREGAQYPPDAVASTGTHDLPTLAGYWTECDVATRERLGWESGDALQRDRAEHAQTREQLLEALVQAGAMEAVQADALRPLGAQLSAAQLTELLVASYRYLARVRSRLILVQLEDAVGSEEQVNVPGTVDEEPNWRRKLRVPVGELEANPILRAIVTMLQDERPAQREEER